MKKVRLMFLSIFMMTSWLLTAQVVISNNTVSNPAPSSILEVRSSNNKGFLPPRVTSVEYIESPAQGLMVYEYASKCIRFYNGTEWSNCLDGSFTAGRPLVDSRDGKSYNTVLIISGQFYQSWMAENLNIGTMINSSNDQTDNDTIEKYCYNNISSNCDTYGGLYQWNEMMQYVLDEGAQGICPEGWHIPTIQDWDNLRGILGLADSVVGGALKEAGTAHWDAPNTGATNSSEWTGLPGGIYDANGTQTFKELHQKGYFWSSKENWYISTFYQLSYDSKERINDQDPKENGMSVRCIKDD